MDREPIDDDREQGIGALLGDGARCLSTILEAEPGTAFVGGPARKTRRAHRVGLEAGRAPAQIRVRMREMVTRKLDLSDEPSRSYPGGVDDRALRRDRVNNESADALTWTKGGRVEADTGPCGLDRDHGRGVANGVFRMCLGTPVCTGETRQQEQQR